MIDTINREIRWQEARITRIVPRTKTLSSFFFLPPEPFTHRAGQHVDVRLTAPDGYTAQRSYSIASAPDTGPEIELAIDRLDDGEVSPFFHDVAQAGDDIELRGPLGGHFVWSPANGGPLLLVGGGSGVVPLLAMVRQGFREKSEARVVLLFSARTAAEAPFLDELLAIEREWPNFTLRLALTRDTPSRASDYGRRIDGPIISETIRTFGAAPKHVFICGSNAFVNVAADRAVEAGLPAEIIRTERYG
ncbi:oxidoreductase [Devosia soli]|uniref:Oxidoreductase n=1 Tax=Devosia soli TaxID=361041 RepID=A0A0F5L6I8_9HYPH|nr:FAD-binding oxidoreductase [Devosia soli]KKB77814.1 oxidoreductase [Devosia soli]